MEINTEKKLAERLKQMLMPGIYSTEKAKENIEVPIFVHNKEDFNVGMTRDDAKNKKSSLFIDYVKTFDKIDSTPDGVLSKEELKYAAENNKESAKDIGLKSLFGAASLLLVTSLASKDQIGKILFKKPKIVFNVLTGLLGVTALYSLYTYIKADKVSKEYA